MRERLASRLGFILLSAGCAIGIGNVWRFPYVTGQSGGGWFVLIYLFFLAVLGIPVLVMEFAVGRAAQTSLAKVHETLTPECRAWRAHGVAGLLGNVLLMMFYTTVTGWMILYFLEVVETTEERRQRINEELELQRAMVRMVKRLCLWIGGAAAALAVLACGAEMINEAVVTGAIALGTTLFGLL